MAMLLAASNFSCPRCRDLTSNLIKSVDAFELLSTENEDMPAKILIAAIRKVIKNAAAKEETETAREPEPEAKNKRAGNQLQIQENVNHSVNADNSFAPGDLSMDNNFDSDLIDVTNINEEERPAGNPNSPLVKQSRKRKRHGGPKRSKNKILQPILGQANLDAQPNPRRSRRQPKTVASTNSSLTPKQDEVNSAPETTSLATSLNKGGERPLATKQDLERASQFMKKLTVKTQDGLHYYIYECTKCFQQFPNQSYNVRRHIVRVHFNKSTTHKSRKMEVQLAPGSAGNAKRPVKVMLYGPPQQRQAGDKKSSRKRKKPRSRVIDFKFKTPSVTKKLGTSRVNRRKSRNPSAVSTSTRRQPSSFASGSGSSDLTKHLISFPVPIPPNLTVRNPCVNFDLERAMNCRVFVKLTPNLTSIQEVPTSQGQGQGPDSKTTHGDTHMADEIGHTTEMTAPDSNKNKNANEDVQLDLTRFNPLQVLGLQSPPAGSPCAEQLEGNNVNCPNVLGDVVKMDVDTIMDMQL